MYLLLKLLSVKIDNTTITFMEITPNSSIKYQTTGANGSKIKFISTRFDEELRRKKHDLKIKFLFSKDKYNLIEILRFSLLPKWDRWIYRPARIQSFQC